ncbi:MAG: GntR family transcriptional regulator, partial [Ruminiclostridium sp.]|nr:GntR family transcriptional regulator [Ruminiclostridium sp.]
MPWEFRSDLPIYTQLIAQIQQRIITGQLQPGDRLPSVRDWAAEAGVNPN